MQSTTDDSRVEVEYDGETYVVDEDDLKQPDRPAYVESFVERYDEESLVGFHPPDTKGGDPFVDTKCSRVSTDAFEGSGWYLSTVLHEPRSNDDALLRAFVRPVEEDDYDLTENPFDYIAEPDELSDVPDEHIRIGHELSDAFGCELHYLPAPEQIAIVPPHNLSVGAVESALPSSVGASKSGDRIYVE